MSWPVNQVNYFSSVKAKKRLSTIIILSFLIIGSIVLLFPIWWMLSTSLKSMQEIMQFPPTFFPKEIHWDNYVKTLQSAPFLGYALNTLFITVSVVIANVVMNSFIAYGFSKIYFKGRNALFMIVLSTMMIPGFVTLIPQYVFFSKIGWINTYFPLIIPALFGNAFFIFLLRQYFMTIPNELIEAAKIDGASHFYIWLKLMIPLTKPALATVAIFSFNGAWNDFLGPLLYVNEQYMYTLQIGLAFFKGHVSTEWNYLMAGSLLVLLPVIILFFIFQRYFIEGMNITAGTKG
ncbi:carbohydrate ABC transporter membrane protein 2 (CUT1 family) [Scopulibacillus darangshiensis]|uniref:Carbohydrate ABC transporter membrane protein 2 (CUT1 family) n=1 Tax=Scopulibacillus darangshiensis TaxID=442528 RepID=A0A4R2P425_9BACL|nr:carbohydrate ABC transporter permease [Scopulibacillus darangshiensis]TCP29473.1 carbohydrate ABC transporter membrane protein 2 (CUT1 family) [Scopulibacillus darangshiensis]